MALGAALLVAGASGTVGRGGLYGSVYVVVAMGCFGVWGLWGYSIEQTKARHSSREHGSVTSARESEGG